MRKYSLLIIMILLALQITGCSNAIPELTEDEEKKIEEYAAHLLIEYGTDHKSNMLTEEEIAKQEEAMIKKAKHQEYLEEVKKKRAEEEANKPSKDSPSSNGAGGESSVNTLSNIAEFIGANGFDISYSSYEICSQYPSAVSDNSFQGVTTATNGNSLVVIKFNITNNTGADANPDIMHKDVKASFTINGQKTKTPLTTLQINDFLGYNMVIPAGGSAEAIMIIQLSAEDAQSISSILMTMKCNGNKASTNLL